MPVKHCELNDKPGFKWGDEGTKRNKSIMI